MGSIENKACINATICIIGVQYPTLATAVFPSELAYASSEFIFHVAILAGVLAFLWPLYGSVVREVDSSS